MCGPPRKEGSSRKPGEIQPFSMVECSFHTNAHSLGYMPPFSLCVLCVSATQRKRDEDEFRLLRDTVYE
jgi:hypothetical protein